MRHHRVGQLHDARPAQPQPEAEIDIFEIAEIARIEAADAFDTFLRLWARADAGRPEIADAREELAALKIPGPRPASKTVPAP